MFAGRTKATSPGVLLGGNTWNSPSSLVMGMACDCVVDVSVTCGVVLLIVHDDTMLLSAMVGMLLFISVVGIKTAADDEFPSPPSADAMATANLARAACPTECPGTEGVGLTMTGAPAGHSAGDTFPCA